MHNITVMVDCIFGICNPVINYTQDFNFQCPSLKLTASSHQKNGWQWNTFSFPFGMTNFQERCPASFKMSTKTGSVLVDLTLLTLKALNLQVLTEELSADDI